MRRQKTTLMLFQFMLKILWHVFLGKKANKRSRIESLSAKENTQVLSGISFERERLASVINSTP
jgi:hypothetical protein